MLSIFSVSLTPFCIIPTLIAVVTIVFFLHYFKDRSIRGKQRAVEAEKHVGSGRSLTSSSGKQNQSEDLIFKNGSCQKEICCNQNFIKRDFEIQVNVKPSFFKYIRVFFATQTGTSQSFALKLVEKEKFLPVTITNLEGIDPEEAILEEVNNPNSLCVFILPTYTKGSPPFSGEVFCDWLHESVNDFRVEKTFLKGLNYAVFGLGDSEYGVTYNYISKKVDKQLAELGGVRIIELGLGDENRLNSKNGSIEKDFDAWCSKLLFNVKCWPNITSINKPLETTEDIPTTDDDEDDKESDLMDVEDIGVMLGKQKKSKLEKSDSEVKEMITPSLRQVLTKQGYKLVGTHSGVKMCRWTKSMLRGRGGCYKHTFYGIESHRCMEATPSLACANKCVFCWRHHSNPVGTDWRWKMDPAEDILDSALKNHYNLINQFKGVPGVKPERFIEGMTAKHCALSLVGEPIMYPEINKFIQLLHSKGISSFLVTNAQFPDAIRELSPVTQLYVSVDASTKDSLKKIDRPLFRDFWERFTNSLKALSDKGQRTVYRLTLVKAWNFDELQNYAELVGLGNPDFIEIKGVTYCGTGSKANNLTMDNVPWHEEVISFAEKLVALLQDYDIASEHEHSNCILIANKKDYMFKTPSWAVFGANERGFDPVETRWHRNSKRMSKDISGC
ncbi:S-adenosyl-L-methionine-dependent tRNA 4-demethylwyosine synthase TYW1-like isoform X2 [Lycorma delicatula]|uniref:S-adenosyl-L-methionine-dependent tRNA 4-demethylwyosine synthase TYW1-like isoform X2 n=1 Tax=Lycorma delicatula TaxID=130591 RepID=UPI003F5105B2